MRNGSARAFALFGVAALLTCGVAAPALAAGTALHRNASSVTYKGKTSQGLPFSIMRSGSKVSVDFTYKAKCSKGPLKSVNSEGPGNGHVSGSTFSATGGMSFPAGDGYGGVYKLKVTGKITATKTSGTFSVSDKIYNVTTGKTVGTCNTGQRTFKGNKA